MTKINLLHAKGMKSCILPAFLTFLFFPFFISTIKAQDTIPVRHVQYFSVTVPEGTLTGKSTQLIKSFAQNGFLKVIINESTSTLQITAPKGKRIEDVKAVLVLFNIGILKYLEEYTNSPPSIF